MLTTASTITASIVHYKLDSLLQSS